MSDCKGRVVEATMWAGKKVQTAWFDPNDKWEKAKAVEELISRMTRYCGFNACEGDCKEDSECRPTSVTFQLVDGSADLGIAKVTMFKKDLEAYVFEVKEEGTAKLTFVCECLPKPKKEDKKENKKDEKK